ncbi:RING finger protein 215 [Geospiza fortis]|uniref:RING finger protein 215 n=1 Tax=Geospiza fortis TaxID=48883 RepID=A0A6I9ZB27_GEOFO|nr:RING finger protein 215 [Geospiza fortis]
MGGYGGMGGIGVMEGREEVLAGAQRHCGPGRFPCVTPLLSLSPHCAQLPRTPGASGCFGGALNLGVHPSSPCPCHVQVGDVEPELGAADSWIGVVPVGAEEPPEGPRGAKEESFTTAVVTKMKRALVLGASALLILALNQNAIRELDVSQLLAKPVIVIQSSDNVTRLLGALLRGLRATAKITYQAVLLENLGVTLTLWSTCGLSRGGLYGEWQGVICPGESSSQVQKYLQQLWNTILLIALLLCTGVMVQAQRQSRQELSERDAELDLKQHIRRRLLALKTRRYPPGKPPRSRACEIDSCAVCLDQFHKSQWLRGLPCSHAVHRDCVDPWLLLQQTCPLCKRNILGNCCTDS